MSGRRQWHWIVSAPGVSAGTAARRGGRLRWIEDRWTKRGGSDDGRHRLRGFQAGATARATARRRRVGAAAAGTAVRTDGWSLAGGRTLSGRGRRLGGAVCVARPVRRAERSRADRHCRLSDVRELELRAVFVLPLPVDGVRVPVVRDRRVRAVGAVRAAAGPRSATCQADHRAGRASVHGATNAGAGIVGRPGAGACCRRRWSSPHAVPVPDTRI